MRNIPVSYTHLVESGKIVRADITPDNLHPNDKGHRLVADEICKLLDSIKAEMEEETIAGENIEGKSTKTEASVLLLSLIHILYGSGVAAE